MVKTKSLKFNLVMNILVTLLDFIFPLISFPYVSRILNPEGMGIVTYVNSIITYFELFAVLGIQTYGIKVCAENRSDKIALTKVYKELMCIQFISTFIAYLGVICLYIALFRNGVYQICFIIASFSIIFKVLGINWLIKAEEEYTYIAIRSTIIKIVSLLLMFILIKKSSDYVYYIGIIVFSNGAANLFNLFRSRKYISYRSYVKLDVKQHVAPMLVFFVTNVVHLVYTNLDIIMLKHTWGEYEVGLYNAALRIENILVAIVSSLGVVVLPKLSIAIKNKRMDEFNKLNMDAVKFILLLSVFIFGVFELCAKECVLILGGAQYENSIILLKILLPIVIVAGIANISGVQILIPLGREKYFLYSVAVGAVSNFVLNLLLLPHYGAKATAFSTLVAEIVVFLVQFIELKRLKICFFELQEEYKIIICVIVAIIMGQLPEMILHFEKIWIMLIIKGLAYTLTFSMMTVLLRIDMIWFYLKKVKLLLNEYMKLKRER